MKVIALLGPSNVWRKLINTHAFVIPPTRKRPAGFRGSFVVRQALWSIPLLDAYRSVCRMVSSASQKFNEKL
jgi:hypothetical protein